MMFEIRSYGKSMYGGWYAEYALVDYDGKYRHFGGEHFERLRDLKEWANENGAPLYDWRRYDNG